MAINLPAAEQQRLHHALAPLREFGLPARWVAPDSLHLTLKFLGWIEHGTVGEVESILMAVVKRHDTFDIEICELGAFPALSRPRVWWVGVNREPALLALQEELDGALEAAGFAREDRPYSPHVTIGRAKGRGGAGGRADPFTRSFDFRARVAVRTVDLMESKPSPRGARYELVLAAPLATQDPDPKSSP